MKIEIDRECCASSGMCVRAAPAVFDQDGEDGRVRLVLDAAPAQHAEAVRLAVEECPTGALALREDDEPAE